MCCCEVVADAECYVIGLGVSVAVNGGSESLLKTEPLTHTMENSGNESGLVGF